MFVCMKYDLRILEVSVKVKYNDQIWYLVADPQWPSTGNLYSEPEDIFYIKDQFDFSRGITHFDCYQWVNKQGCTEIELKNKTFLSILKGRKVDL